MIDFTEQAGIELHTGTYWRSRKKIDKLPVGTVMLLESIRKVDNEPHTLILRGHPSEMSKYSSCERRFLVDDFLAQFEFVPEDEAKEVRKKELAELQGKINKQQELLALAASDPSIMQTEVDDGIKKWEKEEKKIKPGASAKVEAPQSAIVPLSTALTVEAVDNMKLALERQSKVAQLQAKWMSERAEELGSTVKAMTPYITEQAAAALARTEDIRLKVDKLYKGIESLDLYVGKDVDVETIRKGESAAPELPLSVQQSKLFMDEEFSVWADVDEGFDYNNTREFFKVLAQSDGLAKQIFPSERSIICMAVRRHAKDYGTDPLTNALLNQRNVEVFLLVRDGENIHKVWSPVESHLIAGRLFPTKQEIEAIFQERGWWNPETDETLIEEINFMDTRYTDRLEKHEAVSLHYKRFLILLAGLDHRLNLFGTFYTEPKGLNFVSQSFRAKHFNLIADDEVNPLQLQGERMLSFDEWLKSKNEYLRSGSRVIGVWENVMNLDTAPGVMERYSYRRDRQDMMYKPQESSSVQIAFRRDKDIFVKIPVDGETYDYRKNEDRYREFDASVNLSKYKEQEDGFGFLVLDAVKADELERYIYNRTERKEHVAFIRLFKRAAKFLRDEEQRQADTRHRLIEALHIGGIAGGDSAESIVDTAIMAYRAAERGAELPAPSDAKYKSLLNQMFQLAKGETRIADAENIAIQRGLKPLRLAVSGRSTIRIYLAPKESECDNRLLPHSWTHALTCQQSSTGLRVTSESWKELLAKNAAETTIHEWKDAAEWTAKSSPFIYDEKQRLVTIAEAFKECEARLWLQETLNETDFSRLFNVWKGYRRSWQNRVSGHVVNPSVVIPIGLTYSAPKWERAKLNFIAIGTADAAYWLHRLAPNEKLRKEVVEEYAGIYKMKQTARERIQEKQESAPFRIHIVPTDALDDSPGFGLSKQMGHGRSEAFEIAGLAKAIKSAVKALTKDDDGVKIYLAPGLAD